MIKLSKASKMPSRSWSLQALATCPGSMASDGALVPACRGCYAVGGFYNMPSVKAVRAHNQDDWKRDNWVDEMVTELDNDRYFRWFDSGDMYTLSLANKILKVMERTPHCNHWLPTRMYKFAKFAKVIAAMQALTNVVVRFSSDSIDGTTIDGDTTSTIVPNADYVKDGVTLCGAYSRGGKCGSCRACWSKDVKVIAYPAHGSKAVKMAKDIIASAS